MRGYSEGRAAVQPLLERFLPSLWSFRLDIDSLRRAGPARSLG